VSEQNGPVCPECGTPRASDGTPACSCTRRASDTHRDTRTAEAAAAEDFDPVRIRPFVELGDDCEAVTEGAEVPWGSGELGYPDEHPSAGTAFGTGRGFAEVPLVREDGNELGAEGFLRDPSAGAGPRRRRRTLLISGAGAALAVLVTGAFVGGLFSYESPTRDGSASDGVRAPVPDGTGGSGASPGTPSRSVSPSASASASPTSSPPSTPPADESPTPTGSPTPSTSPTASGPSATAPGPSAPQEQDPVLRFGDEGPEVTELQLRLRQIGYYNGDIDGTYDSEVENAVSGYQLTRVILADEPGVYGKATRTSLESETSEP
jgi:hypothetical protein